jgi:hypothetical protein
MTILVHVHRCRRRVQQRIDRLRATLLLAHCTPTLLPYMQLPTTGFVYADLVLQTVQVCVEPRTQRAASPNGVRLLHGQLGNFVDTPASVRSGMTSPVDHVQDSQHSHGSSITFASDRCLSAWHLSRITI